MNVSDKTHPHHAVWREHVQSVLDGKIKHVEERDDCEDVNGWRPCKLFSAGVCATHWHTYNQYRIARPMVTRTITYPAPMSQAPENGAKYWAAGFGIRRELCRLVWANDSLDLCNLRYGMAFATEEDAKAAVQAIFGVQE